MAFVLSLGAYFFELPALSLAVSGMFILLMSGLIVYQTSAIIHGGEDNYISATVTLFVSIYNLFLSLLYFWRLKRRLTKLGPAPLRVGLFMLRIFPVFIVVFAFGFCALS